jgi:hypothetical protein
MGNKMYVSPTHEQAAEFYNRLFPFPQVSTTPYKITGPLRINLVARAVRVALSDWAYWDFPREVVEVCDV